MKRIGMLGWIVGLGLVMGCTNKTDDTANVLPQVVPDVVDVSTADIPKQEGEPSCEGGAETNAFPGTYRFSLIDILRVGSQEKGQPAAIQLNILQSQWKEDIGEYKLNILLVVDSVVDSGASLWVGSGVGLSAPELCLETQASSPLFSADFQDDVFTFTLPKADRIYIYAQDHDGTTFNCTPDPQLPDAIPLSGVSGTATFGDNPCSLKGTITGCLSVEETKTICTCLKKCSGSQHADCPGCPAGAVPLFGLLGGIQASPECKTATGVDGFIIQVDFEADWVGPPPADCAD